MAGMGAEATRGTSYEELAVQLAQIRGLLERTTAAVESAATEERGKRGVGSGVVVEGASNMPISEIAL